MVDAYQPDEQNSYEAPDVDVLYKIYMDMRLEAQSKFYESRIRENQINADFTFTLGAIVMFLSSLVATISASGHSPVLSLLAAILPAFAALLASFRQLYGWERQTAIYRDALMGLERIKLLTSDNQAMDPVELAHVYPKLVSGGERVFTGEVNQWGQFVQSNKQSDEDTAGERSANALISDLRLSDEQIATIKKIVAAGTPKVNFAETITVHPEPASSALPASSEPPAAAEEPMMEAEPEPEFPAESISNSDYAAEPIAAPVVEDAYLAYPSYAYVPTPLRGHDTVPPPEAESALTPGSLHAEPIVETSPSDLDMPAAQQGGETVPPQEAESALTPGALHVDEPPAEDFLPATEDDTSNLAG
ncbi:MAG: SLATT domain-containing protein [Anaerolineae bacterium]